MTSIIVTGFLPTIYPNTVFTTNPAGYSGTYYAGFSDTVVPSGNNSYYYTQTLGNKYLYIFQNVNYSSTSDASGTILITSSASATVNYYLVGGGAGGYYESTAVTNGGGGGSYYGNSFTVSANSNSAINIIVGRGGTGRGSTGTVPIPDTSGNSTILNYEGTTSQAIGGLTTQSSSGSAQQGKVFTDLLGNNYYYGGGGGNSDGRGGNGYASYGGTSTTPDYGGGGGGGINSNGSNGTINAGGKGGGLNGGAGGSGSYAAVGGFGGGGGGGSTASSGETRDGANGGIGGGGGGGKFSNAATINGGKGGVGGGGGGGGGSGGIGGINGGGGGSGKPSGNTIQSASGGRGGAGLVVLVITMNSAPSPSITCFLENTRILTNLGYRFIQNLRKGDLVKTSRNGFKAIDAIGKKDIHHPALQNRIKDQLYKCQKNQYPELLEDLVITGCHSILVDEFSSEEEREKSIKVHGDIYITDDCYRLPACADDKAIVYEKPGTYTIYHFALENDDYYMNYGVYANGLLVETCSKRYLKELANMELIE